MANEPDPKIRKYKYWPVGTPIYVINRRELFTKFMNDQATSADKAKKIPPDFYARIKRLDTQWTEYMVKLHKGDPISTRIFTDKERAIGDGLWIETVGVMRAYEKISNDPVRGTGSINDEPPLRPRHMYVPALTGLAGFAFGYNIIK